MLRYLIIFGAFGELFVTGMFIEKPGPRYPPTKGEVWPKPRHENKDATFYSFNPASVKINVTGQTCEILTRAIRRYSYVFRHENGVISKTLKRRRRVTPGLDQDGNYQGALLRIEVDLTAPCEEYPYLGMDESYNLTVSTTSLLKSDSVWGIIRGLETFTQLLYLTDDYSEIRVNRTEIIDFPRYAHRGLLLDTSRHYITVHNILLTLDAMVMNKMNVFHWHIVDDQSFPYQSKKFPDLSQQGAYHPSMVYKKSDIERIVEYARDRGIRVVPEFDVPGHTRSWGVSYPSILTECYSGNDVIGLGPMNPIGNSTYKLIRDLFQEVQQWFPDKYFHVGGDEVDLDCWSSNPAILEYMNQNNMSSVGELHALFMRNTIPLLANGTNPVVWQEVFDEGVPLSKETIVQVWKYQWISEMSRVLSAGHRVLFSSSWYLDHLKTGGDWEDYYMADPRQMVGNETQNIVGGEACMWGEVVDDRNVISRVWPRASAVAERLWSPNPGPTYRQRKSNLEVARFRLEEHTCRMIRRGIPAQPPNGPGFCFV